MSSTDNRVVQMQFDNKTFMKNAADTSKSLADVDRAVSNAGKSTGLLDLSSQMSTVAVTASKMAVVTTTALATIANKVTNVGINLAKSLTFDPIKQGFSEYEALLTKQNTIMNATGLSAKTVKKYLNELNHYSDRTIYSFGNMSESIMKFVNAGVPLKEAIGTVKGIANAAAYAGASTEDANRAMFAFGQSISNGFLTLGDFNQIETANMATVQFKNTLLESAAAAGTLTKKGDMYITKSGEAINATKGFQYSLQEQWATTKVLNDALGMYNDNTTKLGRKAAQSATEVRTFTAFIDTLKESIGSGWSSIFTALFGNLTQATHFWTGFSNAIGGSVKQFFNFISTALMVWRRMGGFEKVLQGFKNILAPFGALLRAIGDAWSQAFPSGRKGAGKALYELSSGFELITRPLAWLATAIPAITPVLVVFFTAIHKGASAIGDVLHFIWDFVDGAKELSEIDAPSSGGFLGFVQKVTRYLKGAIKQADKLINKAGGLGGLFSGLSLPSLPSVDVSGGADQASGAASKTASGMAKAMEVLRAIAVKMGAAFHWLWDQAVSFFKNADPSDFVAAFNSAIFATMGIQIIRLVHNLGDAFNAFTEIGEGAASVLNGTGSALKSFQTAAQAKLILAIAVAMVALAASLWLLSKIPIERLAPALAAMGALMLMMNTSMKSFGSILKKTDGLVKSVNMVALAASVLLLAVAMVAFAGAMLIMNKVEWASIAKGLITMGVALKLVESLGDMAAGSYKNMLAGAFAIGAVSASMVVLAGALMLFQLVKWKSMGKAGAAIGVITAAIAGIALIPYEGVAKVGLAMLATSVGMVALANALIIFQLVKWGSIGKASVMLGVLAVAVAAILFASGEGAGAAILLATAAAMVALALACIMFNHVDWGSIAKASVVLTILTVAVTAFAAILTVFLYAIAPVAPVLIILAAGFALLGIGLLAFAAAMVLATTLAAAGTAAFAALATGAAVAVGVFLQTLAAEAPLMRKSILAILNEMIQTVVDSVPMIIQGFKDVWAAIMKEMGSEDKKKSFGQLAQEWLDKLIKFAEKNIPKVNKLFVDMVVNLLRNLNQHADDFAAIGVSFVVKLIEGIAKRQGDIVKAAVNLVIQMAEGVRKQTKKLTDAGIDLIAGFLHDLADSIRAGSSAIGSGLGDVMSAMSEVGINMIKGLVSGMGDGHEAIDKIGDIVGKMIDIAKKIPIIHSPSRVFMSIGKFMVDGLTLGVQNHAAAAIKSVASMVSGQIAIAEQYINGYIQRLDQKALAAQGRAAGLAAAAARAQKAANKTKTKTDDRSANHLSQEAKQAEKAAKAAEKKANAEKRKQQKAKEFKEADSFGKAQIKSQNAENQLAASKAAERAAVKARTEANALDKASHAAGVTEKQRKQMQAEADRLRKQARADAERANALMKQARDSAADALVWQKKAGQEAAEAFQDLFEKDARAAANADAFEKLTDTEKATRRRMQAAILQARAEDDLKKAKKLALTDLKAANELAQKAMDEAEQARQYLDDATGYDQSAKDAANQAAEDAKNAPLTGTLNMTPTEAAAWYAQQHMQTYDDAFAAASAGITYNQYNSSPESLSASEIYRQTHNQLAYASDKLQPGTP